MLNDVTFWSNRAAVHKGTINTARVFKRNIPYVIHKTASSGEIFATITEEFRPKIHFALDYGTVGNTAHMSTQEKNTWDNYVDYQDGKTNFSKVDIKVVEEIDSGLIGEVMNVTRIDAGWKSETYINGLFEALFID